MLAERRTGAALEDTQTHSYVVDAGATTRGLRSFPWWSLLQNQLLHLAAYHRADLIQSQGLPGTHSALSIPETSEGSRHFNKIMPGDKALTSLRCLQRNGVQAEQPKSGFPVLKWQFFHLSLCAKNS